MADRFPLILNTSTNQIQEIPSGDNLDLTGVGINNAGIITASSFSGPIVAGAGTSNIVAGIITATQIDLNGDIDVDGHTNLDNLSVAGVSTFAGNADFSSGVDVTGNIIATGELQCKDISLIDTTPKITFFDTDNNPDYTISANSGSWRVTDSTSSAERLVVNSDGHVDVLGNLDVGAGVDVTGNVIASGNVSGVDGTFTGNVSIGGTLTYEDVTNIDSVGIVTARDGVFLPDLKQLKIGNTAAAPDLYLWHNSSTGNSNISNKTGDLYIQGNNGSGTVVNQIAVKSNAAVELNYQGNKKLETTSTGVTISNQGNNRILNVHNTNGNNAYIAFLDQNTTDNSYVRVGAQSNDMTIFSGGGETLRLTSNRDVNIPTDGKKLQLGASQDLQLFHTGNHSRILEAGTGKLQLGSDTEIEILNGSFNESMAKFQPNGGVELYYDNVKHFETISAGLNFAGSNADQLQWQKSNNLLKFRDGTKAVFGEGDDFKIEHNTNENYIDSNSGHIYIRANVNDDEGDNIYIQPKAGENSAIFIHDGGVELYYDSSKKFQTTAAGILVTGNITAGDDQQLQLGANGDLRLYHSSNESYIVNNLNQLYVRSNQGIYLQPNSNENGVVCRPNGAAELYHDNVKKLETFANGIIVYGPEGGGGLINLYADEGDDNADKYRLHSNPNGSFYIQNYTSGSWENNLAATGNGATELYYNNTTKLVTEQGGINVKSPGSDWNNIERTSNGYYGFAFRKEDGSSFNGYLGFTGGGSEINNTSAAQDLVIRSETNIILSKGYSTRLLKTDSNGAVSLYYGNGEKFKTNSSGVAITGMADATGNSARFRTIESGGATVEIRSGGAEGYVGTQTDHKISFITNASRAMTLLNNASHELCVGVKGETGDTSPSSTIGWVLTGGWTKGVFSGGTGANTPWTLYNQHSNFNRYMAYVKFDGGVMSHQSNDGNLCDERIKQDFETVSSQWNNIKNIGLKKFRYQNEPSDAKLKIGVIAQQVETIYPDLVDEDWPIGDANPNTHEKNTGDFYKSVKEEQLQMYSLKALQEAMARIEALEAEVAALKGS